MTAIATTTLTPAERAEINRRNAQKSTGPRTPEGKDRAKFNALKHGMDARTPVLPGEDAEAYRARSAAWMAEFQPGNAFEQFLVEQAARVSWQIERAERAETARLANHIRTAAADQAQLLDEAVAELGRRLFRDRHPLESRSFATDGDGQPGPPENSRFRSGSDPAGDPDHPSQLIARLESTSAGCQWLLDRWAELRAVLDQGRAWHAPEKLRAIRLLGRQPRDAANAPVAATLLLASHVLDPQQEDAFAEVLNEVGAGNGIGSQPRWAGRRVETLRPRDEVEARAVLIGIVDRATSRLEAMVPLHQEREADDAAEQADRLSFDESAAGERLRRLQMYCGRSFLRMIDVLLKIRQRAEAHPVRLCPSPQPAWGSDPDLPCVADLPAPAVTNPHSAPIESIDQAGSVSHDDRPVPAGPVHAVTPPPIAARVPDPAQQPSARNEASAIAEPVLRRDPSWKGEAPPEPRSCRLGQEMAGVQPAGPAPLPDLIRRGCVTALGPPS
jgi:hypothetical protein